jgi:hypothetical protein
MAKKPIGWQNRTNERNFSKGFHNGHTNYSLREVNPKEQLHKLRKKKSQNERRVKRFIAKLHESTTSIEEKADLQIKIMKTEAVINMQCIKENLLKQKIDSLDSKQKAESYPQKDHYKGESQSKDGKFKIISEKEENQSRIAKEKAEERLQLALKNPGLFKETILPKPEKLKQKVLKSPKGGRKVVNKPITKRWGKK